MPAPPLADLVAVLVVLFACTSLLRLARPRARYPPGPRGLPFLGVVRQRPTAEAWKTYARWGREFGNEGLISFQMLGRRVVVINSRAVADDLLVRRAANYSDRPFPTMSGRLMRREKSIFLMPYNARFKAYRRLMHQRFGPRAAQDYWPLQARATHVFLGDLLRAPDRLGEHLRRHAGAVILQIAYGYRVRAGRDRFVALAEESMRVASLAAAPGRWLVDSFPLLRFLPSWLPGAGFKRAAKAWGEQLYTQSLEPHDFVKREMAAGRAVPSFTSQLLSEDGACADAEREDLVLWAAGALYAGGSDTTVAAVHAFFYLMACHPDVQQRAQAEIDALTHGARLPTLADRAALPYVGCVLKEVLRWHAPVPLALPHAARHADAYRGYTIPAGALVVLNVWALLHDPAAYPAPGAFDPARFAGARAQADPRDVVFGRARRACPGVHVAEASLFLQIAGVLAAFDVRAARAAAGRAVAPPLAVTSTIVSHIAPFPCAITPRSARARALVEEALALGGDGDGP